MVNRALASSWIRSVEYVPLAAGVSRHGWLDQHGQPIPVVHGFLVLTTQTGARYAHATPAWCVGLMCATKSPGHLYNSTIRGRFPSVKLTA